MTRDALIRRVTEIAERNTRLHPELTSDQILDELEVDDEADLQLRADRDAPG